MDYDPFGNEMKHNQRAFGNNYTRNPEYQRHVQSCEASDQFRDWFHGNEIRGDMRQAITALAGKLAQLDEVDVQLLEKAFFYKPPQKEVKYSSDPSDEDLPF